MLLRNLNVSKKLCNGTRFRLIGIRGHCLTGEHLNDNLPPEDRKFHIPRILITPGSDSYPFRFQRLQFPIIPAFAMTITKSQGGTFDWVGLFLLSNVFTHGQLYVAVSRVKSFACINVLLPHGVNTARNIVFRHLLDLTYRDTRDYSLPPHPHSIMDFDDDGENCLLSVSHSSHSHYSLIL